MKFRFTSNGFDLEESPWQEECNADRWALVYRLALEEEPIEDPGLNFTVKVASSVVKALSQMPEIEFVREQAQYSLDPDQIEKLIQARPFASGDHFVDALWIQNAISSVLGEYRTQIASFKGTVESYFATRTAQFKTANRVFFHLVENKSDESRPFAFLATYATAKSRHVPLGNSLAEYRNDQQTLIGLLSPLSKIAERSSFVRKLIDTGELFKPIRLTANEAYDFLTEIPIYEESGVYCRIPNFWKQKKSHKFTSGVAVGSKTSSMFGVDSLLDFEPFIMLDGRKLTRAELRDLMNEAEGLRLIKGQWVEVNHQELQSLLDSAESLSKKRGLTLLEALQSQMGLRTDLGPDVEVENGQWLAHIRDILTDKVKPDMDFVLPARLTATLRPYQKKGYDYLMLMRSLGLGACLADDMGLGKTVQVIAQIGRILEEEPDSSILLVLPTSLVGNWENELDKFLPGVSRTLLTGPSKASSRIQIGPGIHITTYGLLNKLENVTEHNWSYVVLDEAQAIKNSTSSQSKTVRRLKAGTRLVLTGTPVENNAGDLWSIFDFLDPGLLGSKKEFSSYLKTLETGESGYAPLRKALAPFILRRMKTDRSIISDLPDKIELKDYPQLTKLQASLYQKTVDALEDQLDSAEGIARKGLVLATIMKLKQICNHPDQYSGQELLAYEESESGKFEMLDSICENISASGERVLVFTQFREIIPALDKLLCRVFGQPGLTLDGSTPAKQRTALVKQFNAGDYCPYMILSLKAGGVGLNLTAASHVVHFDRWWNPAVENQATDRAFRIGQKKNVVVHSFVTKGTIEEKIDRLLEDKRALSAQLLSSTGEAWITELDNKQLLDLCRLDKSGGAI